MKAIVKTKREFGAELKDVDVPKTKPDEVLVKVKATSICGTDVHIYELNDWAKDRIKNIPQILGHEFCGEIVEVGRDVKNFKEGDYVSAETHIYCGYCVQCDNNQRHICGNLKILGVDCNGCFAEYIAVPERVLWKNKLGLPIEIASVQEPLGNAVYCTLPNPKEKIKDKSVLIIGDGPIGILAAAVAKTEKAYPVILVGRHPFRMELALKMGADLVLDDHKMNVEKKILEVTQKLTHGQGQGMDIVLEMAGSQKAINQAFKCVRKGGRVSCFGIPSSKNITLNYANSIVFKGTTIYGINGRLIWDTWEKIGELFDRGLDISPVITHRLPLEKFKEGFKLMMNRPKVSGKVVFVLET